MIGAIYVISERDGSLTLVGELVVDLQGSEIFVRYVAPPWTRNARKPVQQTCCRIAQFLQQDGSSLTRQGKESQIRNDPWVQLDRSDARIIFRAIEAFRPL